jgi:hypothetical protein
LLTKSGCGTASENRQLREAGQAVDRLLGLFLDQAGHRHRAARGISSVVSARRVLIEGIVSSAGTAWSA